jgi:carbamoyl-phosphate synthase large subunit
MNVQFAVKGQDVYVLEVNPRASRTVPFVSKAIGVPLAKIAARVMAGKTLAEIGFTREIVPPHVSVKEAVFPFLKFPGVDTVLGPEMKSTGEVMGIGASFGVAFANAEIAAGTELPLAGTVFISVRPEDRDAATAVARRLHGLGFRVTATRGTADVLTAAGIRADTVNKVSDGSPHIVDALQEGTIALVINTPQPDAQALRDSFSIRRTALERKIPYFTTIAGAQAAAEAIAVLAEGPPRVRALQDHHRAADAGR